MSNIGEWQEEEVFWGIAHTRVYSCAHQSLDQLKDSGIIIHLLCPLFQLAKIFYECSLCCFLSDFSKVSMQSLCESFFFGGGICFEGKTRWVRTKTDSTTKRRRQMDREGDEEIEGVLERERQREERQTGWQWHVDRETSSVTSSAQETTDHMLH